MFPTTLTLASPATFLLKSHVIPRIADTHVWPMPFNLRWNPACRRCPSGRNVEYGVQAVATEPCEEEAPVHVIGDSPLSKFNNGLRPVFDFASTPKVMTTLNSSALGGVNVRGHL